MSHQVADVAASARSSIIDFTDQGRTKAQVIHTETGSLDVTYLRIFDSGTLPI
jgi:hypothetical protein